MGSIYKRGNKYWIKYYRRGRTYREGSGSSSKMVATHLLKLREGEIAQGKTPSINFEKITFDELVQDYQQDYKITGKKSLDRAERSVKHLTKYFEGIRVPYITTPLINTYIEIRQKVAANGTINRELSALKAMLNIGRKQTPPKVRYVPHIQMLIENNIRRGFFEHVHFLALRNALPEYLKGFVTFAYKTGWRVSEITGLTWARIDREKKIVRLEAGETKNDEGRILHLDDELVQVIGTTMEFSQRKKSASSICFPQSKRHWKN